MYTIYAHKNLRNEKYYVGCTRQNPKARWQNGLGYKNNSKMWNDIQNSDWNKDWVHGILGKFDNKQDALNYEAFLIAMLDTIENGYNTSEYGSGDFKRSEETKRKMSDNHADFSGENNPLFGKHHSEETKNKMSEAQTGEKNHMFGKHHSEESKKRMAESKGVYGILQYSKDGELIAEYPSIRGASRQTGCNQSSICQCCKGTRKSAGGYIWMYAS